MKKYIALVLTLIMVACLAVFHVAAEDDSDMKPAKTITPVEPFSGWKGQQNLVVPIEYDEDWAKAINKVTYSYEGIDPVELTFATNYNPNPPKTGRSSDGSYVLHNCQSGVYMPYNSTDAVFIVLWGILDKGLASGETRDFTFTISAEGYEDTVFVQPITNPAQILQVSVKKGAKTYFTLEDLTNLWKEEGGSTYTYSIYDTWPDVLEIEKHYGPTLEKVFEASNIDVDSLANNDVIEFVSNDGYKARITVEDYKKTRYYFPNGASPNYFKGTTPEQLEGSSVVPYIISLRGGEKDIRNIFGQLDPQDEQKNDYVQKLSTITIYKGTAPDYNGLKPTIDSGSTVKKGDRLFFDLDTFGWQGGSQKYAGVFYTVSTDGTEPDDPTLSSTFFNPHQYGDPSYIDTPEYFNYYEFTGAETTIIKAMAYVRGYTEPQVTTLTYHGDPSMYITSSKGTDLTSATRTTLKVENAKSGYKYRFVVKNNSSGKTWSPWEGFKESNSFEWYAGPQGAEDGKTITVYVKDADNNDVGEPLALDVNVSDSNLQISTISCSDTNPLATDTVELRASAIGGKAPYRFRFRVQNNNTGKWWTIQDFNSANKCTWYAGPAGGSKTIYVDVKDSNGDIASKQMIVGVADARLKIDNIKLVPEELTASTTTTITANVSDPSNDLQYRFRVYNNGTGVNWEIQPYGKSNSCTWWAGPSAGSKTIYVDVKDAKTGTITSKALDVTVNDDEVVMLSPELMMVRQLF